MKKLTLKYALINSSLTTLYIMIVGAFFHFAPVIFKAQQGKVDSVFAPILMLLLFVFSASLCGALVLGRPVLWYLDGKKKEAIELFIYTILFFFIITLTIFAILLMTV